MTGRSGTLTSTYVVPGRQQQQCAAGDRKLETKIGGRAEARPRCPEWSWKVSSPWLSPAVEMRAGKVLDERQRLRRRAPLRRGEKRTGGDRSRRRHPDARQLGERAGRDVRHHSPPGGHQPGLRAAMEHGDGGLGDDGHAQRVRKRTVVRGRDDGRERLDTTLERGSVQADEARPETGVRRCCTCARTAGVPPRTSDPADGEEPTSRALRDTRRRRARAARDRRRASGATAATSPADGWSAPGGTRRSSLRGHATPLDAWRPPGHVRRRPGRSYRPVRRRTAAGRAGRGTRPRGAARRRTARARAGGPRPSARPPRRCGRRRRSR